MTLGDRTFADWLADLDNVECWRPVCGYANYSVSSWGRISGPRAMLTPAKIHGYLIVSLSDGPAGVKNRRLHVLVAEAFLGKAPFPGAVVAHNNGDKENCRLSNLRWASALENAADVDRHGNKVFGSKVHGAKLTETDIPTIRVRAAAGEAYESIADDYGVSISTISLIKLGKIWKQCGGAAWAVHPQKHSEVIA